jgi:hypothetical protein
MAAAATLSLRIANWVFLMIIKGLRVMAQVGQFVVKSKIGDRQGWELGLVPIFLPLYSNKTAPKGQRLLWMRKKYLGLFLSITYIFHSFENQLISWLCLKPDFNFLALNLQCA